MAYLSMAANAGRHSNKALVSVTFTARRSVGGSGTEGEIKIVIFIFIFILFAPKMVKTGRRQKKQQFSKNNQRMKTEQCWNLEKRPKTSIKAAERDGLCLVCQRFETTQSSEQIQDESPLGENAQTVSRSNTCYRRYQRRDVNYKKRKRNSMFYLLKNLILYLVENTS